MLSGCRVYRNFSYQTPLLWNQLPVSVQRAKTLSVFKSRLKMFIWVIVLVLALWRGDLCGCPVVPGTGTLSMHPLGLVEWGIRPLLCLIPKMLEWVGLWVFHRPFLNRICGLMGLGVQLLGRGIAMMALPWYAVVLRWSVWLYSTCHCSIHICWIHCIHCMPGPKISQ